MCKAASSRPLLQWLCPSLPHHFTTSSLPLCPPDTGPQDRAGVLWCPSPFKARAGPAPCSPEPQSLRSGPCARAPPGAGGHSGPGPAGCEGALTLASQPGGCGESPGTSRASRRPLSHYLRDAGTETVGPWTAPPPSRPALSPYSFPCPQTGGPQVTGWLPRELPETSVQTGVTNGLGLTTLFPGGWC